MPIAASTEGKERIPREIVSAIMTADVSTVLGYSGVRSYSCPLACHGRISRLYQSHVLSRDTHHHFIVLYLTSAFVSSPNGSSLPLYPRVGRTVRFSGSFCPSIVLS